MDEPFEEVEDTLYLKTPVRIVFMKCIRSSSFKISTTVRFIGQALE